VSLILKWIVILILLIWRLLSIVFGRALLFILEQHREDTLPCGGHFGFSGEERYNPKPLCSNKRMESSWPELNLLESFKLLSLQWGTQRKSMLGTVLELGQLPWLLNVVWKIPLSKP